MALTTASRTRVFIGDAPLNDKYIDFVVGDFDTLAYTEVKSVEEVGDFGDEAQDITIDLIDVARTKHLKGNRDAGTTTITCAFDSTDPGQQAMIAASQTDFNYPFRVELDDPQNVTGDGTTQYFIGLVMSERLNVGGANNVVRIVFNIGINSNIVRVASTAGV